jgi:hypothetical protein
MSLFPTVDSGRCKADCLLTECFTHSESPKQLKYLAIIPGVHNTRQ